MAEEKGGNAGRIGGGREKRAGEVATSPRKSRVMPTRNCTTPRAPLPTPPRIPSCSHTSLPPFPRPRLWHATPSVSPGSFTVPTFLSPLGHPLSHPRDPCRRVPRVWCAFSPASASYLTDLTHPRGITPSSAAPAVSAALLVNLGETETIAAPTSTRCD